MRLKTDRREFFRNRNRSVPRKIRGFCAAVFRLGQTKKAEAGPWVGTGSGLAPPCGLTGLWGPAREAREPDQASAAI